jgi:uncharacterized membrane protein YphA (DoxX/SURF4 family)
VICANTMFAASEGHAATFIANRYWELGSPERFAAENAFYEHLGLAGGFLLIAWHDLRDRRLP